MAVHYGDKFGVLNFIEIPALCFKKAATDCIKLRQIDLWGSDVRQLWIMAVCFSRQRFLGDIVDINNNCLQKKLEA